MFLCSWNYTCCWSYFKRCNTGWTATSSGRSSDTAVAVWRQVVVRGYCRPPLGGILSSDRFPGLENVTKPTTTEGWVANGWNFNFRVSSPFKYSINKASWAPPLPALILRVRLKKLIPLRANIPLSTVIAKPTMCECFLLQTHSALFFFYFSFTDMNVAFHWCVKKDLTPLFTKKCDLSSAFCFLSSVQRKTQPLDVANYSCRMKQEGPTLFNVHIKPRKGRSKQHIGRKARPGFLNYSRSRRMG